MLVRNPYTGNYSCWRETLHWVLRQTYTEKCSWKWQTLHWGLLMVATNLTLRLAHGGNEPNTETCSWWWQTLHWDLFIGSDKPYTETLMVMTTLPHRDDTHDVNKTYVKTYLWWRATLHFDILLLVANLKRAVQMNVTNEFDLYACHHYDAFNLFYKDKHDKC